MLKNHHNAQFEPSAVLYNNTSRTENASGKNPQSVKRVIKLNFSSQEEADRFNQILDELVKDSSTHEKVYNCLYEERVKSIEFIQQAEIDSVYGYGFRPEFNTTTCDEVHDPSLKDFLVRRIKKGAVLSQVDNEPLKLKSPLNKDKWYEIRITNLSEIISENPDLNDMVRLTEDKRHASMPNFLEFFINDKDGIQNAPLDIFYSNLERVLAPNDMLQCEIFMSNNESADNFTFFFSDG